MTISMHKNNRVKKENYMVISIHIYNRNAYEFQKRRRLK